MEPLLVIGGWPLPSVDGDNYRCWEDPGDVKLEMISRRMVIEQRGKVWKASYACDYLPDSQLRPVLAVLRSGAPFLATVLPDNSDETVTSTFLVESLTDPKVLVFDGPEPIWHGLAFTLREEQPHD